MEDRDISPTEIYRILQKKEKYRKLKADINNQVMIKLKKIMEEQLEKILEQGAKEGKEDFLRKIVNNSGIQGVNAI